MIFRAGGGPTRRRGLAAWLLAGAVIALRAGATEPIEWQSLPPLPDAVGFGGPFAGVCSPADGSEGEGVLVVAGGTNFPDGPHWAGGTKAWHSRVFVLPTADGQWVDAGALPRPSAFGISASHGGRVWCVGGCDSNEHLRSTVAVRWNKAAGRIEVESDALPPLPVPVAYGAGAMIGTRLFVAGGQTSPTAAAALRALWSLDFSASPADRRWREHPAWPGPPRMLPVIGACRDKLYLVSGVELLPASTPGSPPGPARRFLADAYEFDPATDSWRALKPPPVPMPAAASPAIPLDGGDGPRLLFLSGNDWGLFSRERELRDRHPGFSRQPRIYDPATDAWEKAVPLPEPLLPVVTTTTVRWGAFTVVPSGEIRPCARSPQVFRVRSPAR